MARSSIRSTGRPKSDASSPRRSTRSSVLHGASGSKVTSRSTSLSAFAVPRATEPKRDSSPIRQRRHSCVSDSLDGKMIVSMAVPLSHKALAAHRYLPASDLRVARAHRIDTTTDAFFDPAELLQDLLAVGHAAVDLLGDLAGKQQGGAGHHERRLAARV